MVVADVTFADKVTTWQHTDMKNMQNTLIAR